MSTVRCDDTGGDRDFDDFDDFVLEVAVVGRRPWRDIIQAVDQADATTAAEQHVLRHLRNNLFQDETDQQQDA